MSFLQKLTVCCMVLVAALLVADFFVAADVDCDSACANGQYNPSCPCFRHLFRWGKRAEGYRDDLEGFLNYLKWRGLASLKKRDVYSPL